MRLARGCPCGRPSTVVHEVCPYSSPFRITAFPRSSVSGGTNSTLGQAILQRNASRLAYLFAPRAAVAVYRDPRSAVGLWDVHFSLTAGCTFWGKGGVGTVDLASLSDTLTILVSRLSTPSSTRDTRFCYPGKMQSEGTGQVRARLQGRESPGADDGMSWKLQFTKLRYSRLVISPACLSSVLRNCRGSSHSG